MLQMHWGGYGWGMGYGWIVMLAFWALIVFAFTYLIRILAKRSEAGGGRESPLDILKHRYAKGEISREEFERMKNDIMKP